MQKFLGKNILVVGASSGIGKAIAQILIDEGANVISASRNKPENLDVPHISLDVLNMSGNEFEGKLPDTLHGIAYCPGTINLKPFARLSEDDFLRDFKINALGAIKIVQACMRDLKKAKGASVVFFSTVAVQTGMGFHASIASAKGAIEGLTRSLAAELVMSKIRVNAVAPSLTDTPLAGNLLSTNEKKEASAKRHPLGSIGKPEDIASAATYLLSEESGWMTGQILKVDGGISSVRNL
ncbi:MAG: SDR family oxidoreductase [Bacteroidota bacterium]